MFERLTQVILLFNHYKYKLLHSFSVLAECMQIDDSLNQIEFARDGQN